MSCSSDYLLSTNTEVISKQFSHENSPVELSIRLTLVSPKFMSSRVAHHFDCVNCEDKARRETRKVILTLRFTSKIAPNMLITNNMLLSYLSDFTKFLHLVRHFFGNAFASK